MYRIYIVFQVFQHYREKNATFWQLVHVVLAEIHESVSLYFDQDCMRKNKKVYPAIFLTIFDCFNSIYFRVLALYQYENEIQSQ